MSEVRFNLPSGGLVTGTLLIRQPTPDEEYAFCDAIDALSVAQAKQSPNHNAAEQAKVRVQFVNALLVGASDLVSFGQAVDLTETAWRDMIPVTWKRMICLKYLEAGFLFSQDDSKNSVGPSVS
jgi:hypothetical protein